MSVRAVRELVQPILAAETDVALDGRRLVLRPVGHFVRMVFIDRTSSKEDFNPIRRVHALFLSEGELSGGVFEWIYSGPPKSAEASLERLREWAAEAERTGRLPPTKGPWTYGDPVDRARLAKILSGDVFPRLRAIRTLQDCYDAILASSTPHSLTTHPVNSMLFEFVLGRRPLVETMAAIVADEIDLFRGPTFQTSDMLQERIARLTTLLDALRTDGHKGALRVLHTWERQLVEAEKLTPFWQPTPFPVEEMGLV